MTMLAMNLEINETHIDFAGLQAHGVDYQPV